VAKRIDILFGSRIDESGAKKDIERIQTIFKSAGLKIVPQFDNTTLKEFQKNLKVTIDEATKLRTLTSSFTQGGIKYDISQRESSRGQWSKPVVSMDYEQSIDTVEKKLKSLYRTAIETQENINAAAKVGAATYQKQWEKSLSEIEAEIKSTKETLATLGYNVGEDRGLNRLSGRLGTAKLEQDAIEQKKLADNLEDSLNRLIVAETNLEKAQAYHSSNETIQSLQAQVDMYRKQIRAIEEATHATEELKQKAREGIESSSINAKGYSARSGEKYDNEQLEAYSRVLKKVNKYKLELAATNKKVDSSNDEVNQSTEKYINSLKEEISKLERRLDLMQQSFNTSNAAATAAEKRAEAERECALAIDKLNKEMDDGIRTSKTFGEALKDAFDNYIGPAALADRAVDLLVDGAKEAYQTIVDLNKAMTDVQMVTGESAEQTAELAHQYSQMAKELGATTTEVANGAAEWLRQGKSVAETNQLLESSMILSKVGAIESSQATELLTSTLNGYKKEANEAMHVVDAMSAVDLAAATSVEELAVALQSTANMARVNGVGFEQLLGMVGAVSEASRRSASVVGNSFKTIFSRLTNVAAGKMTDDLGEPLNDVEQVFNGLNIKLRDSSGEFRNMYDVISELADRWEHLDNVEQNWVATSVAGTRQRETFLTLMENWDRAATLSTTALNSEGMAMDKMSIYLESIEANLNKLKAAVEDLLYSEEIVNVINLVIKAITQLVEGISWLIDKFGGVNSAVLATVAVFLKLKSAINIAKDTEKVSGALKVFSEIAGGGNKTIKVLTSTFSAFKDGVLAGKDAINISGKALWASPFVKVAIVLAGITAIVAAFDALITTTEEYKDILAETQSKLQEVSDKRNALEQKAEVEQLTEAEKEYLEVLKAEEGILQAREKRDRQNTYNSAAKDVERGGEGFWARAKEAAFMSSQNPVNELGLPIPNKAPVVEYNVAIEELTGDIEEYKEVTDQLNNSNGKSLEEYEALQERQQELSQVFLEHIKRISEANTYGLELTETDKQLAEMMEKAGITAEALSESMGNVANELGETDDTLGRITSEVSGLQSAYDNLISVNEEVANTGVISIETLDALVSRYPALNDEVTNYLLGLASTEDVLAELRLAYQDDEANAYANIINKLKMQQNYYSLLSTMDSALMQQFAAGYGIDIGNHGTYAQSKEKIETDLLQRISSMWAQFYKSQALTMDNVIKAANGALKPDGGSLLPTSELNALKNVVNSYNNAIQGLNNVYDESIKLRLDGYKQISSAAKDAAKSSGSASKQQSEAEKAYDDLLQITIKMLKKKKELEKEALKEQLEGYKKVIDAQKDLLDLQDDEYNHKRELEEKNKTVSTLEAQIAELQFDTSAEGTKKRLELEEELAEAKRELEDYQHDYSIDQQKDALDREERRFEEYINNQIDEIDDYLSKTGEITAEAIRLLQEHSEETLNALIQYNRAYGDSIDQNIIDLWNKATGAVNTYKSALDEAASAASRLAAASGGGGLSYTPQTIAPPNTNTGVGMGAMRPSGSSPIDTKYRIFHTGTNKPVGGSMSLTDAQRTWGYIPDPQNYYWEKYVNGIKRNLVYAVKPYHTGLDAGFVGNLKGNEEFVKALKGEAFVTRAQQDRFMNNILPDIVSKTSTYGGATFDNLLNINVQGNLDSSVVPDIERISNDVFKRLNKAMFQGGYKRNTNTVSI
jgi:phage tail tape measure protein, TP901 family